MQELQNTLEVVQNQRNELRQQVKEEKVRMYELRHYAARSVLLASSHHFYGDKMQMCYVSYMLICSTNAVLLMQANAAELERKYNQLHAEKANLDAAQLAAAQQGMAEEKAAKEALQQVSCRDWLQGWQVAVSGTCMRYVNCVL